MFLLVILGGELSPTNGGESYPTVVENSPPRVFMMYVYRVYSSIGTGIEKAVHSAGGFMYCCIQLYNSDFLMSSANSLLPTSLVCVRVPTYHCFLKFSSVYSQMIARVLH